MNPSSASLATRFKVGIFTILGLLLVGAITVYVNDKPYWWRSCQLVHINVEDGTGLKSKSPIKSLGIEIGYLQTVELFETHVSLGICITAPVEVLPATRAYLRGEGFLGDKFVELKPVKYIGARTFNEDAVVTPTAPHSPAPTRQPEKHGDLKAPRGVRVSARLLRLVDWLVTSAQAEEAPPAGARTVRTTNPDGSRQIPVGEQGQDVQHLVNRVDELVNEMTNLTTSLKTAIDPDELRSTMKQLNRTLENASRTLSPEGGLNQTAQRTLAKLEDAIEQLRDQMTRTNKGEGSVGMLLNDPSYADEIREAIRNVNRLLSKVGGVRFVVDVGGEQINAYSGGRGFFRLQIYPKPDRYYLVGISLDPRGKITSVATETTVGGQSTMTNTRQIEQTGLLLTGMLGKVYARRLDLALGALNGDGAISVGLRLGPVDQEELLVIRNDAYSRGSGFGIDDRLTLTLRPWVGAPHSWSAFYMKAGVEGFRSVTANGPVPYFYGAGLTFDDEDIKLLFALR